MRTQIMKHHPSELGLTTAAPPDLAVRTLAAGDRAEAARWDAFVAGAAARRSSIAPAGSR